jgi:hypothetical protein
MNGCNYLILGSSRPIRQFIRIRDVLLESVCAKCTESDCGGPEHSASLPEECAGHCIVAMN